MIYITSKIKTDFNSYFYRTVYVRNGTGNESLDKILIPNCPLERMNSDIDFELEDIMKLQSKRVAPETEESW